MDEAKLTGEGADSVLNPKASAKVVDISKEVLEDVNISFDNGTPIIYATYSQGIQVFKASNLRITELQTEDGKGIASGTYPCSAPPRIGFLFNNSRSDDTLFVDEEAEVLSKEIQEGTEICRINIKATKALSEDDGWLVGQTWFQGRYVQHQINDHELKFAL